MRLDAARLLCEFFCARPRRQHACAPPPGTARALRARREGPAAQREWPTCRRRVARARAPLRQRAGDQDASWSSCAGNRPLAQKPAGRQEMLDICDFSRWGSPGSCTASTSPPSYRAPIWDVHPTGFAVDIGVQFPWLCGVECRLALVCAMQWWEAFEQTPLARGLRTSSCRVLRDFDPRSRTSPPFWRARRGQGSCGIPPCSSSPRATSWAPGAPRSRDSRARSSARLQHAAIVCPSADVDLATLARVRGGGTAGHRCTTLRGSSACSLHSASSIAFTVYRASASATRASRHPRGRSLTGPTTRCSALWLHAQGGRVPAPNARWRRSPRFLVLASRPRGGCRRKRRRCCANLRAIFTRWRTHLTSHALNTTQPRPVVVDLHALPARSGVFLSLRAAATAGLTNGHRTSVARSGRVRRQKDTERRESARTVKPTYAALHITITYGDRWPRAGQLRLARARRGARL